MSSTTVTIRRATPADADALASFGADTFRDTYGHANDPNDMALHIQRTFTTEQQLAEILNPTAQLTLALDEDRIAGYAYLLLDSPHAQVPLAHAAELKRFYLGGAWQGRGVAQSLMRAVLEEARRASASAVWLTVWSENTRARRFYDRMGFEDIGETIFLLGTDPQSDRLLQFRY
jgi:ribosomal protein S18 acetylase RimI-like enzyme